MLSSPKAELSAWQLKGNVTFYEAANIEREMSQALQRGVVRFDWQAVDKVDSAAVALALQLQRIAVTKKVELVHCHLPQAFLDLADLYGVSHFVTRIE